MTADRSPARPEDAPVWPAPETRFDIGLRKLRDYRGGAVLSDAEADALVAALGSLVARQQELERELVEAHGINTERPPEAVFDKARELHGIPTYAELEARLAEAEMGENVALEVLNKLKGRLAEAERERDAAREKARGEWNATVERVEARLAEAEREAAEFQEQYNERDAAAEAAEARLRQAEQALRETLGCLLDVAALCSQQERLEAILTSARVPLNEAIRTARAALDAQPDQRSRREA